MIYVRITEGLGNQLFKYACAFAVSKKNNDKIVIDLSGYAFRPRGYMLDQLNISGEVGDFPIPRSDGKICRAVTRLFKYIKLNQYGRCKILNESKDTQMKFAPYDFTYDKNIYIVGYWQNPQYFSAYKSELISEFSVKEGVLSKAAIGLIETVSQMNSVAVHIRRGDYSNSWLISEQYYFDSISYMKKNIDNPHFFIFCEDYSYAREFAKKFDSCTIVCEISKFTDIEEFFLISACKNQIIANSTFSWWAAYLNQNPRAVIVAPSYKQWSGDYYPSEWIKIVAKGVEEENDENKS